MSGRPQDGWPEFPIYHSVRLWTMSVKPGWQAVGLDGDSGSKLLAAYAGATGDVSVLGLDTSGAARRGLAGAGELQHRRPTACDDVPPGGLERARRRPERR